MQLKAANSEKSENNRNKHEDEVLFKFRKLVPDDAKATILTERGFCDVKLFEFLKEELNFEYNVKVKRNILITTQTGEKRTVKEQLGKTGRSKTIRNSLITHEQHQIETVV